MSISSYNATEKCRPVQSKSDRVFLSLFKNTEKIKGKVRSITLEMDSNGIKSITLNPYQASSIGKRFRQKEKRRDLIGRLVTNQTL